MKYFKQRCLRKTIESSGRIRRCRNQPVRRANLLQLRCQLLFLVALDVDAEIEVLTAVQQRKILLTADHRIALNASAIPLTSTHGWQQA